MAMCASCQVYVDSDLLIENKSLNEEAMLSEAFYVKSNSRLCCQIQINKDIDGCHFELAPE